MGTEPIRVITVFQPWASLIMVGAKPYEFRSKRPPRTIVGQRVVIHAAARKIMADEVRDIIRMIERGGDAAAEACLKPDLAMPVLARALVTEARTETGRIDLRGRGDLPWGCGLGTAICGEGRSGYDIAEEFGAEHVNDSDRDDHANYGWPMSDIEVWSEPIPGARISGDLVLANTDGGGAVNVPVNRHQRRRAIAMASQVPMIADPSGPVAPNYTMRVLVIDGTKRMIGERVIRAGPEHFAALIGKRDLNWAKIDEIDERVHIMLAGDDTPQELDPDHRWFEGEFEVLNAAGEASPVLHGRAAVFGYMPALKKAGSTPVTPLWLQERVRWLDRGAAAALEGRNDDAPLAIEHQARLEDQSRQVEGSEEP